MFGFDERNNRISETYPSGTTREFVFDQRDRLVEAVLPAPLSSDVNQFVTLEAARVADTTNGTGLCDAVACGRLTADDEVLVDVAGHGGVPATGAVAVTATITVTNAAGDGWVRVGANGDASAAVAAAPQGAATATSFTAELTTGGLRVVADVDVDVAVDVSGFWREPSPWVPALNLRTIDPVVGVDTTTGVGSCGGVTCATLGAGEIDVHVTGVGDIPSGGVAAVNVAILASSGQEGGLRVGPNGAAAAGEMVWSDTLGSAGNFTVPVNGDGTITLDPSDGGTDVMLSLTGYWATPTANDTGTGLALADGVPQRLVDTATGTGVCDGQPCDTLEPFDAVSVAVAGHAGLDEGAEAVMISVTTGVPTANSLITFGPDDTTTHGSLLVETDRPANATMIVPIAADGTITMSSWNPIDLTIDVIGWFEAPTTTWTYEYSPSGQRTAKQEHNGPRYEHTWTNSGGLPLLLAEHRDTDTSYLVYGPAGTPIYQIAANGLVFYYHQDHQGSTRLTTTHTGHTRGTHTYTAHGAPLTNTTGWLHEQPLAGYTSQYHDHETGHIHLRARQYDPTTAQFTSLDPLVHLTEEPYGYSNGNPANKWDPTGLWGVRLGPIQIGNDGCILGTNPNGSCRGSDVENVVDTANKASGVVAAPAGICTAAGALSLVGAPVAAACAPVAVSASVVNLGTGFALVSTGRKSPASIALDFALLGSGSALKHGATKATAYSARHVRTSGVLHWLGVPTVRQLAGELTSAGLWFAKGSTDAASGAWQLWSWHGSDGGPEC